MFGNMNFIYGNEVVYTPSPPLSLSLSLSLCLSLSLSLSLSFSFFRGGVLTAPLWIPHWQLKFRDAQNFQ